MGKKAVKFEAFLDGICSFWQLGEDKLPVKVLDGIRFQRRVIGMKRNFLAQQSGYNVELLIRVPKTDVAVKGAFVVIGENQFQILQAQTIPDTIPKCTDLTLTQPDILLEFDQGEAGAGGRLR